MPKNATSLFWSAYCSGLISAFFAGAAYSSNIHGGFLVGLAFVAVCTLAAIVTQIASD